VDSTLKADLEVVDLLSLGLGIERQLGVVLQGKLFGAEELGFGGRVWEVRTDRLMWLLCQVFEKIRIVLPSSIVQSSPIFFPDDFGNDSFMFLENILPGSFFDLFKCFAPQVFCTKTTGILLCRLTSKAPLD